MKTNWLHGLIVLVLLGLLMLGYYWYNRDVIVGSAEEYIEDANITTLQPRGETAATPTPTTTIELTEEEKVTNPTLGQGTTVFELEDDLNQTMIKEEDFSNL